jgi:PEP-CTERM motif
MMFTGVRQLRAVAVAIAFWVAASPASAAIISQWTFEAGTSGNPPSATGTDITGISPATGPGVASGHHASPNTVWDNPAGNGSAESFSSNTWAVDDYYQFQTSTTGLSGIGLSFSQTSSSTGPRDFKIQYSTNGTTFTDAGANYVVLQNGSPNPSWSAGTPQPAYNFNFNFAANTALNNQATLYFRLVDTSTVSAGGGTVGAGGTSRVDNVTAVDGIPEPATMSLLALASVVALGVSRRCRRLS